MKMVKSNKSIDLAYTLLYGWMAAWGLLFLGWVPDAWVETVATIAAVMMILDIMILYGRFVTRNQTRQTRLSHWME